MKINIKSISRGRKNKGNKKVNLRSKMLKMVMPLLSNEIGEKLAAAIEAKDTDKVRSLMDKVKQQLTNKVAESTSSVLKLRSPQDVNSCNELDVVCNSICSDITKEEAEDWSTQLRQALMHRS